LPFVPQNPGLSLLQISKQTPNFALCATIIEHVIFPNPNAKWSEWIVQQIAKPSLADKFSVGSQASDFPISKALKKLVE
jgi:hypothetical protein